MGGRLVAIGGIAARGDYRTANLDSVEILDGDTWHLANWTLQQPDSGQARGNLYHES